MYLTEKRKRNTSLFRTISTTSSISGTFSYQSATSGGATLSLYAKYVGRSPRVTVGGSTCTNVVVSSPVISPSVLLLGGVTGVNNIRLVSRVMPSGQDVMLPLVVSRGPIPSSPRYLSYIPPTVDWVGSFATSASTTGKVVNLIGCNFGLTPVISMFGAIHKFISLENQSHDTSRAKFTISPGEGENYTIRLVVENQETTTLFNYNPPVLYRVDVVDATTEGGSLMTIRGENFGTSELSDAHAVSIGGSTRLRNCQMSPLHGTTFRF